ncbi:S8 family serine peptidase [Neobacillus vireti]|uniref:Lactocepin n=1 Tax=Neobacillus vireti LMG 21834 TaxID=1131730 RepID=A0AB94IR65_9BACI|nr:S8 family serine peptidase [Neobacillus vireti]ETI69549.1 lactocepin [Neobacillus vireti LMG 21834]
MKKKTQKKAASYALASALVLSNLGFAASASAESTQENDFAAKVKQLQDLTSKDLKTIDSGDIKTSASLNPSDRVRVIVEVDGQTPVEFATQEGKLYKDLAESKKSSLASTLVKQQNTVKDKISAKGVKLSYKKAFTTAFNGFSGDVQYGEIAKIEAIPGVKNVYIANEYNRPEETPEMKTSHSFIQSQTTWADAKLKGEGMVVAVIDTGVDPSHRDFKVTDASKDALTKAKVDQAGLKGKFFTDKVPYGYNYYDENNTILDLAPGASMHGMHVAGTVAANGDEANGGIKGVSPEAQVLGMKVFSNDPNYASTSSDIYLAAIDDSIKLGADVLNMSLGSTASFYDPKSAEDLAITRAVDNGIVCSVSAGNSGHISYGYAANPNPYASNPDIGVVGAPGLNTDTIQVAAAGNVSYLYQHNITVDGAAGFTATGFGIDDWTDLAKNNTLQLVSLGGKLGAPADYAGLDVKGKIVVMPRGDLAFADKTKNAAAAGAAGIIVYNSDNPVFYENQGGWQIPFMKIQRQQGLDLEAAIKAGNTTLRVTQTKKTEDPEMGRMTDFTSWGVTPNLDFKPEITAPGGKIYSTVNNNQYEVMSGTSMAAPHVAGGSALVQQYLKKDDRFKALTAGERTHFAKVLLMNTSSKIVDLNGQPFSPRRQGAGMMQTFNAVSTPVVVVEKSSNEGKVALKDFTSKQFTMNFTAKNISDKAVTYAVNTDVLTDTIKQTTGKPDTNALIAGNMDGAVVDAPKTLTVPAGQSVDFSVKVDLTNAKIPGLDNAGKKIALDLKEDIFVEGFVTLTDMNNKLEATLNVPYVGFYGKWDRPSILDGFKDFGETKFFNHGLNEMLFTSAGKTYLQAPVPGKQYYAVSPNGDGLMDNAFPLPTFLRNASEAQFNVLDKDGKLLRRVALEKDVRKSYYNSGNSGSSTYNLKSSRAWDGTVNSKQVDDGLYYYEIKAVVDYKGAEYQSKKIPVYVDTTAPKVKATYDNDASTVNWTTDEQGVGVMNYAIYVDGKLVTDTVSGTATSYKFATPLAAKTSVEVFAIDYAYNVGSSKTAAGDTSLPLVFMSAPSANGTYRSLEVPVSGYATDDLGVEKVQVNGEDVALTYDAAKKQYNFSTTVKFEKDGKYKIPITVTDIAGKEYGISRIVYVDTTPGEIVVDAPEKVGYDVDQATVKLQLKDNFNYLSLYVGADQVFVQPYKSPVDVMTPADTPYEFTVDLKHGENKVSLRLQDFGGNETKKDITIFRAEVKDQDPVPNPDPKPDPKPDPQPEPKPDPAPVVKNGWNLEGNTWFYYTKDVKKTGWLLDGNKWYYLNKNGAMQTGWVLDGGKWYLLNKSGAMQTGWVLDGGKWYLLNKSGAMQTGWALDGGKWYFLNNSGAMQTGWLKTGGEWYHLSNSGAMNTGWKLINGKWYYLNLKSGKMAYSTTIDGYKLGSDGAWIK